MLNKKYPCIMQRDSSDCVAATIATVLQTYKMDMSITKIREVIGTNAYGTSVDGMVECLENLHFKVKAIHTEMSQLTSDITYPCIAQTKTEEGLNHFVVIHNLKDDVLSIADPAKGFDTLTRQEFEQGFTGICIMMVPSSDDEQMSYQNRGMFFYRSSVKTKRDVAFLSLAIISLILIVLIVLEIVDKQWMLVVIGLNGIFVLRAILDGVHFSRHKR